VSLINKMLQDLDARQTTANEAAYLYSKPVARREARLPVPAMLGVAGIVLALALAAALGWHYWRKPQDVRAAQTPVKVVMLPKPSAAVQPVAQAPAIVSTPEPAPVAGVALKRHELKPEEAGRGKSTPGPGQEEAVAGKVARAKRKAEEMAAVKPQGIAEAPVKKGKASEQGKEESPSQKAESSYRRALASLQDGYVSDAIASLDDALEANPKHDAARQTVVSLLIENGRVDEAMRQLQLGLTLDPRQPSMAMLLARLQIERGATGIETLVRTLPYAGSDAQYHAFLAGALQRQQRHREAAEQYQAALQRSPRNGVWWMGLGISLQAEKREAEALDAFRKAKGAGTLTPELVNFVDRKIQQLGRQSGA
jgi:MSHA biogenesis protein MshN